MADNDNKASLDWPKHYNIINWIAKGLLYRCEDSRLRVINKDLKASNILLDYNMDPRISGFGIARSSGVGDTESNTARVVGTYGCMSPEYATEGAFSTKLDIYSFGVLVTEILNLVERRTVLYRLTGQEDAPAAKILTVLHNVVGRTYAKILTVLHNVVGRTYEI